MFDSADRGTQYPAENPAGGGVSGGPSGALGSNAKSVVRRDARRLTYNLQRYAAKLLPEERVRHCRWTVQRCDQHVEVLKYGEDGAAYAGLQTCGSVWSCPVCSRRISEQRRSELNVLLEKARAGGYAVVMLTLTASHRRGDCLAGQLAGMKSAKRRMRQRRDWRAIKDVIVGSVTATEATYGRSGWHTHFHEIFVMEAEQDEAEKILMGFSAGWLTALEGQGMSAKMPHAYQVQGADRAGEYVSKWGAAEELALGASKQAQGGGRTPFQLLHDAAVDGDEHAGILFKDFAKTFKGSRQLVWSRGLKEMFCIDQIEDEVAAADCDEDAEQPPELVGLIDPSSWSGYPGFVGARYRRVRILEAAEGGGTMQVSAAVSGMLGMYDEEPQSSQVIEDD